ncbi:hypothetical protein PQR25_00065 [Paraburkholderia nemoris]|uniref:hypothetical protein n=1 Tax=Paraburkholderia nemoris TaxID=2793076 RepID=UPI0038B95B69
MKTENTFPILSTMVDRFPPMPLYRSDLDRIVKIGTDRGLKLIISESKDSFDSLDALREERGDRIKRLWLKFYESPYTSITVSMGTGGVRIETSKVENLLMASLEIKEAFVERLPVEARIMKPYAWGMLALLVFYLAAHNGWKISQNIAQCVALLLPLYLFGLSCRYIMANSVVHLVKKHEVEGFWSRYGEKALLLVAGSVLTVLGQLLVHQLTSK